MTVSSRETSAGARAVLTGANILGAAGAAFLVFGPISVATPVRAWLVVAFSLVYVLRVVVTTYVTVQRPVTYAEAALVGGWMFVIHVTMGFVAAQMSAALDGWTVLGVVLYVFGSWMNTFSELQRRAWKARAENTGHLYTLGLFRWCRHPNYLGDTLLFTGFAAVTGSWVALVIPAIMAAGFVFAAIPALDRRLEAHYGDEFDRWAAKTSRYIPLVW
jgi:protein-S-isoprenylcysteine O-methyltransferase Ste14